MAKEQAHTAGPWHRNIQPARKYPTVWAGRNTHVAVVVAGAPRGSGNGEAMSDDELEANINLIAAAPDLLAALKDAHGHLEHMAKFISDQKLGYSFESLGEDIGNIRDAIAKAEGC